MTVTIIAVDKDGNTIKGSEKIVDSFYWGRLQKIDRANRWKEVKKKEVKYIKKEENGRKKRSGTGNAVKKA